MPNKSIDTPKASDTIHGEGNYQATRDYNDGLKKHIATHDVEREAHDAAPRTPAEEKEMADAERKGAARAKGKPEAELGSTDDLAKTE
jgi:hypothetical protein